MSRTLRDFSCSSPEKIILFCQTALQARLEKVRERKIKKLKAQGKEIPNELLQPIQLEPEENQDEDENVETENEEKIPKEDLTIPKSLKVREWDEGKDWVPAAPERPPRSWKDPREERPNEFAPPSFYYKNSGKKNKNKTEDHQYPSDNPSSAKDLPEGDSNLTESLPPKENTVKESLTKPSAGHEGPINDVELRTNRVLDFLEQASAESTTTAAADDVAKSTKETASEYKPLASDKPFSIKIKPLSSKTKTLLTKSALDDAS